MSEQRPIVSPRPSSDAPAPPSTVVPRPSGSVTPSAKTIAPVSGTAPVVARIVPRRADVPTRIPTARRKVEPKAGKSPFVLDEDIPRTQPPVPSVKLGDIAEIALNKVARGLIDDTIRCKATRLQVAVRANPGYVLFEDADDPLKDKSKFHRSRRRVWVEYKKGVKPAELDPKWTEDSHSRPIIRYAEQDPYGKTAYAELTNNDWRTDHVILDKTVRIMESGMMVQMRREQTRLEDGRMRDRYVYRPCDKDGNIIDFPLVGKISEELFDAESVDTPRSLTDIRGEPMVMYDIKRWIRVYELPLNDGEMCHIIIVVDRAHKEHHIVHYVPKQSDPDPELDRE